MPAPHDETWKELIAGHALRILDPQDRTLVEGHLRDGCRECEADLASFEHAASRLAFAADPVAPSDLAWPRIRGAVETPAAPAEHSPRPWLGLATAASLAVAAGTGIWASMLLGERQQMASALAKAEQTLSTRDHEHHIAIAPGVRTVSLSGMEMAPDAVGQTYLNPTMGKAVFYAFKLPPPTAGRTYQLWFIIEGKPVSAGIFAVDGSGNATLEVGRVDPMDRIDTWAVTLEPEGGVPQPTGQMYLRS